MDKRVIVAIVLCVGILALWAKLFPPPQPSKPAPVATAPGASAPPDGSPAPSTPPPAATGVSHPERQVEHVTPDARFVLSRPQR